MATSSTTLFDMDFTEIAEEAWERVGVEMRTGYALRTARRSMNLLTIEWQNRGLNLWTIDEGEIPLLTGVAQYDLPADTVDLLEQVIRTNGGDVARQNDLLLTRINTYTYANITNKLSAGRPSQFWIERLRDNPRINVWPVPNNNDYAFHYWRMRRVQDAGDGMETADMNFRFLPCLVAGLAYYISLKVPDAAGRVPMLKQVYEEQFRLASEEDRDKTTARFVPRVVRV